MRSKTEIWRQAIVEAQAGTLSARTQSRLSLSAVMLSAVAIIMSVTAVGVGLHQAFTRTAATDAEIARRGTVRNAQSCDIFAQLPRSAALVRDAKADGCTTASPSPSARPTAAPAVPPGPQVVVPSTVREAKPTPRTGVPLASPSPDLAGLTAAPSPTPAGPAPSVAPTISIPPPEIAPSPTPDVSRSPLAPLASLGPVCITILCLPGAKL